VLQTAVKAANRAKQMNYLFTGISILAIFGATIALYSYFTNTNSYLRRSQDDLQTIRLDLEKEKRRSEVLEGEINNLNQRLEADRKEIEELKRK
jgi:ATP-dependent protease HslVU (ClpYQ) peptidase subunit